jgi:hypothetical protein
VDRALTLSFINGHPFCHRIIVKSPLVTCK